MQYYGGEDVCIVNVLYGQVGSCVVGFDRGDECYYYEFVEVGGMYLQIVYVEWYWGVGFIGVYFFVDGVFVGIGIIVGVGIISLIGFDFVECVWVQVGMKLIKCDFVV